MRRRSIYKHKPKPALTFKPCDPNALSGISTALAVLSQSCRQVTYALLTRSPVYLPSEESFPLDLHVLGTPPAFVLSQDQTLRCISLSLFDLDLMNRFLSILRAMHACQRTFFLKLTPLNFISSKATKDNTFFTHCQEVFSFHLCFFKKLLFFTASHHQKSSH